MRGRYYSPELRRFINADIIPGEISDSTSLNRYAYVNGNPVSNIDPFGLKGFWSGLWNGVKKVVNGIKDTVVSVGKVLTDSAVSIAQRSAELINSVSLYIADAVIFIDSVNNRTNIFSLGVYGKRNYEYNVQLEESLNKEIIDSQYAEKVGDFKFGWRNVSFSGCEAVAVYNAMYLLGHENVSLADTIRCFEEQASILLEVPTSGYLGSNPYSISHVLKSNGIDYTTVSGFNSIDTTKPGIYIMSYWNEPYILGKIHTITIEVKENGKVQCYNYSLPTSSDENNEDIAALKKMPSVQFISGYKLEQPATKNGRK